MLLSMYASYYASRNLAKIYKRDYVLSMAVFIVLASLFSAAFAYAYFLPMFYPLGSLSFPFSSTGDLDAYNIQFLALRILSVPPQNGPLYGFPFYLLVNLVGVMLGYWINKRPIQGTLKEELFDFFFFSGFISFMVCFFIYLTTFFTGFVHAYMYPYAWFIVLFCIHFFWIPAVIATTIYGMKSFRRRENSPHNLDCKLC